jgi:hypothetical protein
MGSFESLSGPDFQDWFAKSGLKDLDDIMGDLLDGKDLPKIPKLAIVTGLLQAPLTELKEAQKPFKAADRQILSWTAYLLVTQYLRSHQVGFFKRHLFASCTNALIFAALYPEEYKAQLKATKKFYTALFEAIQ